MPIPGISLLSQDMYSPMSEAMSRNNNSISSAERVSEKNWLLRRNGNNTSTFLVLAVSLIAAGHILLHKTELVLVDNARSAMDLVAMI